MKFHIAMNKLSENSVNFAPKHGLHGNTPAGKRRYFLSLNPKHKQQQT
jgi:hypothetical protein